MSDAITQWMQWIENSSVASSIRQSIWVYPGIETVHIIGIVLLVGPAFMFDLRLLGFSARLPVTDLAHYLLPWSRLGLALVIPSGILLFITNATVLIVDPTFWLKMLLLVIAGFNVVLFHSVTFRSVHSWNKETLTPKTARLAAICSIIVWLAIITCGRLLAY
jgi:hypothetical protein